MVSGPPLLSMLLVFVCMHTNSVDSAVPPASLNLHL